MLSLTATRNYGPEYDSFVASCPLRKIQVDQVSGRNWLAYEAGDRRAQCPLVLLPPLCGRANCYYKQLLGLSALGYRCIALEWPACWSIAQFCSEFFIALEQLNVQRCHLFGTSLGGYLAQRVAEQPRPRNATVVQSLVLCNSFINTSIFHRTTNSLTYWALPAVYLKQTILRGLPAKALERPVADSIDFMVDNLDSLTQSDLASRLTLNCSKSHVDIGRTCQLPTTIISVFDDCALTPSAIEQMHAAYPTAKRASLKKGGNFPYLSASSEINMHIQVHLRQFTDPSLSALGPSTTLP